MAELVREIMIDATPETIWPFLTDPARHVEWLGTVAEIDPRPGGGYRVLVGGKHQSAGEYLEVVPLEKVAFTFGWEEEGHPIPPGSTTIEISLHPEGSKTLVRLVHRGLPDDAVGTSRLCCARRNAGRGARPLRYGGFIGFWGGSVWGEVACVSVGGTAETAVAHEHRRETLTI